MRVRAVVLAAGLGTRLRPLTTGVPKPLLAVLGRPLIAWTLERLAASGVEATAINLHHRGEAIADALGDRFGAMPLLYSREETLLGTLGALHPLREFLAPADLVLLVNGDSLCRWPFAELIARHLDTGGADTGGADTGGDSPPLATLLLSGYASPRAFGGGVAIDDYGRVVTLLSRREGADDPAHKRSVFIGAHVFAPSLALEAPFALSDIVRDLYEPRLLRGDRIESLVTDAPWHDVGTPARYLDAVLDWSALEDATGARDRAIVEAGATLEDEVEARSSLVLGGARIGRSSRLDRAVIGPGVVLPAGSRVIDTLVTPRSWGVVAGSREEGDLVYTPLELAAPTIPNPHGPAGART